MVRRIKPEGETQLQLERVENPPPGQWQAWGALWKKLLRASTGEKPSPHLSMVKNEKCPPEL